MDDELSRLLHSIDQKIGDDGQALELPEPFAHLTPDERQRLTALSQEATTAMHMCIIGVQQNIAPLAQHTFDAYVSKGGQELGIDEISERYTAFVCAGFSRCCMIGNMMIERGNMAPDTLLVLANYDANAAVPDHIRDTAMKCVTHALNHEHAECDATYDAFIDSITDPTDLAYFIPMLITTVAGAEQAQIVHIPGPDADDE